MPYIEVVPAYGRDYTRAADAKADWKNNKDFQITESLGSIARPGQYVSRENLTQYEPGTSVIIRYNRREKVTRV